MSEKLQAIRGMNDVLPHESKGWQTIEDEFKQLALSYGYREFRTPILESTRLFKRTIGEITDIVEKEMYTFVDKNQEEITLRPEGTAGIVRACLEHGLLRETNQKYCYIGPMFRHEKPQKGRYRQFQQLGLEAFGCEGIGIELEMIHLCHCFWQKLGLSDCVQLEINTLATLEERHAFKVDLTEYFQQHFDALDLDSQNRLDKNPLRILDSKHPDIQSIISNAPSIMDYLTPASHAHFEAFCQGLEALGIPYRINPSLVRGLDYYQHTVFEWVTDKLGSQATVCAGGRFDGLISQLGGPAQSSAFGLAMGLERLLLLLQTQASPLLSQNRPDVYVMYDNSPNYLGLISALNYADQIRQHPLSPNVMVHMTGGRFKSQFKKADKLGAKIAVILGEDELNNNTISLKDLDGKLEQCTIQPNELLDKINAILTSKLA